jgi:ATP-dependent helicase HrpA
VLAAAADVLRIWASVRSRAASTAGESGDDVRKQLTGLVHDGFVSATGAARLPDVVRYLRALEVRLDRLAVDPARDAVRTRRVRVLAEAYDDVLAALPAERRAAAPAREVRWLLEELRVSLFAQQLGTRVPVSEQRVLSAIESLGLSR